MKRLNELTLSVDSIEVAMSSSLLENLEEIELANSQLTNEITKIEDTISLELALLFDQFKSVKSQMPVYQELVNYIDTNVVHTRESLANLIADIEGANGDRKNYDTHIEFEATKVDALRSSLEELIIVKSSINEGYNTFYNDLNDELTARSSVLGTEIDE